MKTYTTPAGQKMIIDFFTGILPTKAEAAAIEKTYSLGFLRLEKLSQKKRRAAFTVLGLEGFGWNGENTDELKRRLEAMTEAEFMNFKRS